MATKSGKDGIRARKYPKTPHLPFSPGTLYLYKILNFACIRFYSPNAAGVQDDDIVLSAGSCRELPFLKEEIVITEKLDGGNCSISCGKVCGHQTLCQTFRNQPPGNFWLSFAVIGSLLLNSKLSEWKKSTGSRYDPQCVM